MLRGLEHLCCRDWRRALACSAWRGDSSRETLEHLPVPKGGCYEKGDQLYTQQAVLGQGEKVED